MCLWGATKLSIVFDARKHAEQSKRGREITAEAPRSPELGKDSSDLQSASPNDKESRFQSKQMQQLRSTARVARSTASWAPQEDAAKGTDAQPDPIVRSLLRTPRSGPFSAAPHASHRAHRSNIEPATLILRTEPVFPPVAKKGPISESVELQFRISPEGKVYDVKPVKGSPILAQAAIEAVQAWCYEPARLNGAPIDSQATTNFDFNLD
jgi:TonB family protein